MVSKRNPHQKYISEPSKMKRSASQISFNLCNKKAEEIIFMASTDSMNSENSVVLKKNMSKSKSCLKFS